MARPLYRQESGTAAASVQRWSFASRHYRQMLVKYGQPPPQELDYDAVERPRRDWPKAQYSAVPRGKELLVGRGMLQRW